MMYLKKPKLHKRQSLWKPPSLKDISLDVTSKCNMCCPHCYAETFRDVELVGLDVLNRVLDEFYELGVFHYVLQGGEAVCESDRLEAIIGMIHPDETYINVATNGWDMTLENIRWLKGLMVDKISFSLDSGVEEEHDAFRCPGSYKRVIEGIDHVIREGLDVSFSITITHDTIRSEGFQKAYEYAKKKRIRIEAQIAEPVGRWDGRTDLLLTPDDILYLKYLDINSPLLVDGRSMIKRDIYRGNKYNLPVESQQRHEEYCPAGTEFMALSPNGELLPCNFLQFSLGNIRDRSVREMRDALLTNGWFNQRYNHCLIGENKEFIDRFVMPYVGIPKPLDANKIFNLGM